MNVSFFQVDWAPNRFFDSDDNGTVPDELFTSNGNLLAEKLEVAYLERTIQYKQKIKQFYAGRVGPPPPPERRPTVKVDLPGGTETVVFGEELDARLMEIYVLHGWWDGILRLEKSLARAQKEIETRSTEPWFVVVPFYLFTRNRLILLIRQALIEIEKKAAQDIIARLSLTAMEVNTAWNTQFQFEEISPPAEGGPGSDEAKPSGTTYSIGNRGLSDNLFLVLSETVKARTFLDEQNEKRERLESTIEGGEREFGKGNAPGVGGTYMELEDTKKLIAQTNAALNRLYEQMIGLAPLAMLALPLLKQGFEQPDMENIIGETLWPFYRKIDKLAEAIDPQTSLVEMNFPGIQENVPNATHKLESLFSFGYNIEVLCAEKSISTAVDNPAYLPLLSEETLYRLIETKVIEQGTLTHIVCQRYTLILMKQIENKRESEEMLKTFFEALARIGAGLSLASLLLSSNPAVSAPLRIVSAVLGIPVVLFQMYSVVHQLSAFDQAVNLRLTEPGTTRIESLAGIGELSVMRAGYAQQITQTMLTEIGLLIAGGKWAAFKQGLHVRGYYADLEVLLED